MTWIHCSIKDGSCVALTSDANFRRNAVSEKMATRFFHVHVNRSLDECRPLIDPVEEGEQIAHKYRGFVSLDDPLIASKRDDIINPRIRVEPFDGDIPIGRIGIRTLTMPDTGERVHGVD